MQSSLATLLFVSTIHSSFVFTPFLFTNAIHNPENFVSSVHCLYKYDSHLYALEKWEEELKSEVNRLKDTLSRKQDKLKTRPNTTTQKRV